jgi:hypothetical protein
MRAFCQQPQKLLHSANSAASVHIMSAEVAKKRGRPKKVVLDPVEAELLKPAKNRAKSTAAAPKPIVSKTTAQKASKVAKPASKAPPTAQTSPNVSPQQTSKAAPTSPTAPATATPKTLVTPQASKILSQVRELSAKTNSSTVATSKVSSIPPKQPVASKNPVSSPQKQPVSPIKPPLPTSTQASVSPPKTPQTRPSKITSTIPITSLNSQIVDNITTRAGARPNTGGKNSLPAGYKAAARKVTFAIVAMPIVIVTSWVLYERCKPMESRWKSLLIDLCSDHGRRPKTAR